MVVALVGVGLVNARPGVAFAASVAGSEPTNHIDARLDNAARSEGTILGEYAAATPEKRKVKKETLWLMIGLLASMAIAGLVSAIRRAKNIRED